MVTGSVVTAGAARTLFGSDPRDRTRHVQHPTRGRAFAASWPGTLILEAIVVLLALPVVAVVGGGLTDGRATYLLGLAAVLIMLAGLQGRPWAIWANLGVQVDPDCRLRLYPACRRHRRDLRGVWAADRLRAFRGPAQRRDGSGLLPGQQRPARRSGTLCAVTAL